MKKCPFCNFEIKTSRKMVTQFKEKCRSCHKISYIPLRPMAIAMLPDLVGIFIFVMYFRGKISNFLLVTITILALIVVQLVIVWILVKCDRFKLLKEPDARWN